MLFGEIVEQTTRALIDDDFDEYPDDTESISDSVKPLDVPPKIESLIFVETTKIIKLFQLLIIDVNKRLHSLNEEGLQIYALPKNVYVVEYKEKDLTTGQIIQLVENWIKNAKNVYTITSALNTNYQNPVSNATTDSFVRKLSTQNEYKDCIKLEIPNILTGLGADILSYCLFSDLKCTSYIFYTDSSPLDSITSKPVLELVKSLQLPLRNAKINIGTDFGNVYL